MHGLKLQTTMNEVEPGGTLNIHRCSQLPLSERLSLSKVGRWHCPVGQCDLYMKRRGNHVGHHNKSYAKSPSGDAVPEQTVSEEKPVAQHA